MEEANLLNPAFCSITLISSVAGYQSVMSDGIQYPLLFMILPMVLHKRTRENLPSTTRTSLAAWLQINSEARVGFSQRVIALKPYTREAIMFGMINRLLSYSQKGYFLTSMSYQIPRSISQRLYGEVKECVQRSKLIGKWLAHAGTPETVMALWGIRP